MGDAPDKPDPTGFLRLAAELLGGPLGEQSSIPVAYLGDTVADVLTVKRARQEQPDQPFLSLAVAPPHLHTSEAKERRSHYEWQLREAGADVVIPSTTSVLESLELLLR
jgi:HAD superfamily phosphatase